MEWFWTWSGSAFGFREGYELWTYKGLHIGRVQGHEVYGPDGHYLGEVMDDNRLIIDITKKTWRSPGFHPWPERRASHPVTGLSGNSLPEGYEDFPRPVRFR